MGIMITSNPMMCRCCQKYIGHKIDLEDYFFWCDKKCHDQYEDYILNPPEPKAIERKTIVYDEILINTKKRGKKSNAAKIAQNSKKS